VNGQVPRSKSLVRNVNLVDCDYALNLRRESENTTPLVIGCFWVSEINVLFSMTRFSWCP